MKKLTRKEMLRYAGNTSQLVGARRMAIADGTAGGMRVAEVKTGAGLAFTVLEDKCLDIYDLSYKGINLAYQCKNGLVHGERYSIQPGEFLKLFTGGGLFTCGMMNVMEWCEDPDGTQFQKHGAIQHRQADHVYVKQGFEGDEYRIELGGTVTESKVLGYHLELQRKIETGYASNTFTIRDTVCNCTPNEEGIMMVYHLNLGYPFICEETEVVFPAGNEITPLTPGADLGEGYCRMPAPEDNAPEMVTLNRMPADGKGMNRVLVINHGLELGVLVESSQSSLPYVCYWKCPCAGDYVIGIEPTNACGGSREAARQKGTLRMVPGYGSESFVFRFTVLEGAGQIAKCRETMG